MRRMINITGVRHGPLQWVLWDVKDTLLKVRISVGEQYCKEAQNNGVTLNPVEVNAAFLSSYRHYSSHYPNYGIDKGLGGHAWWLGVVQDTFSQCRIHDPTLLNTMAQNLYKNFCSSENWEVFPDSKRALESCTHLGLKLGVVSNFDNRLEEILHNCGLLSYFSFLITSEEVGVAKPNPVIFKMALKKCGIPANNAAHIGDHYVYDYLTSRSVGINGYLLDRQNGHQTSDMPPEHRLSSLDELLSCLKQHLP